MQISSACELEPQNRLSCFSRATSGPSRAIATLPTSMGLADLFSLKLLYLLSHCHHVLSPIRVRVHSQVYDPSHKDNKILSCYARMSLSSFFYRCSTLPTISFPIYSLPTANVTNPDVTRLINSKKSNPSQCCTSQVDPGSEQSSHRGHVK